MNFETFIDRVQQETGIDRDQAVEITQATLGSLGEILSPRQRRHLASQLPAKLREFTNKWNDTAEGPRSQPGFPLERFYNRIAARANLRYPDAVRRSKAVVRVLSEVIGGEVGEVVAELGDSYSELFGAPPKSPASPSIID